MTGTGQDLARGFSDVSTLAPTSPGGYPAEMDDRERMTATGQDPARGFSDASVLVSASPHEYPAEVDDRERMTATGQDLARGFSDVSALIPIGPGEYAAEVDAQWTVAGKPNGGYLLAMLARAAIAAGPQPDVLAASAHYLRSPGPGPVTVRTETLREGRSAVQMRARMSQDSRVCVEALLTLGRLDPDAQPYWQAGLPASPAVPFAQCVRLFPPEVFPVAMLRQAEVRLEPASHRFAEGAPSGRGELRGWLALPGNEPFDSVSLQFALDAFPPATFDIDMSGWVPTLELTTYVRAIPAPGPVRVLHRAQLIQGERVDEACFVWDGAGRLVAQSTQLAAIRIG